MVSTIQNMLMIGIFSLACTGITKKSSEFLIPQNPLSYSVAVSAFLFVSFCVIGYVAVWIILHYFYYF